MKKMIVAASLLFVMVPGYALEMSNADAAKFSAAVKAYRMNQNSKALTLFSELYANYPQNQQIKNNYAVLLFGSGKVEKAEEILSSVIESNKEVNIPYKNLNKIYDFAAAKAYANALGTEKEVMPQKLQIIEELVTPPSPPAEQKQSSATAAIETAPAMPVAQEVNVAPEKPVKVKPSDSVKVVTDKMANDDVNGFLVGALMDAHEPLKAPSSDASSAVLDDAIAKAKAVPAKLGVTGAEAAASHSNPGELAVVENAVNNWADAWSKGDAESYITYYEPSFRLGKLTHNQWIANRKQRIKPSENIQVKVSDLVVAPSKSDDTITATFKQSYHANHFQDNTSKQLVWKKIGDKWFIKNEVNLN